MKLEKVTVFPFESIPKMNHMDPEAKAGFIGLALRHGPGHFVRALLEESCFRPSSNRGYHGCLWRRPDKAGGVRLWIGKPDLASNCRRHLESPLCHGTGEQASERAGADVTARQRPAHSASRIISGSNWRHLNRAATERGALVQLIRSPPH